MFHVKHFIFRLGGAAKKDFTIFSFVKFVVEGYHIIKQFTFLCKEMLVWEWKTNLKNQCYTIM